MQLVDGKEIRSLKRNIKFGAFAERVDQGVSSTPKFVGRNLPSAHEYSNCRQRTLQLELQL